MEFDQTKQEQEMSRASRLRVQEDGYLKKRRWRLAGIALLLSVLIIWVVIIFIRQNGHQKTAPTQVVKPVKLSVKAKHAIVIDAQTGQILGQKDSHSQVGIASQSKMLTSYAVLKAIKAGKLHWDDKIEINKKSDWSNKDNDRYAHLDIHSGQKIRVSELFGAMYTSSANDAALALADYVKPKGMTEQEALNFWAHELHLNGSKWYNATGQVNEDMGPYRVKSASDKAENTASVEQLAILARKNLELDPNLRDYYEKLGLVYHPVDGVNKIKRTEYAKFKQEVVPKLKNKEKLRFEGLKTGSTPESGGAFTGLLKDRDGHEFITVVSGAGRYTDQIERYQDTIDAVEEVLQQRKPVTFNSGEKLKKAEKIRAPKTQAGHLELTVADKRTYWLKKLAKGQLGFDRPNQIKVDSVRAGERVLSLRPALKTDFLSGSKIDDYGLPLASQKSAKKASDWQIFWRGIF